ncbi:RNA polymerase sigma factor [Streptosporangium sp. NPDC001559]|uniref:RNA polymerase sigma factor n=1 Tax=Streptosporangium sp. NPDC001559 TaxID=3366187 RepID=UPI0036F1262B
MRSRLRAGDPAAFSELFGEHAQTIYRYAARTTGDRTAAEDVVSLTFLEAWRLRGRLRPDGDGVGPWLFGIATNVMRNTARAARRHRAAMSRIPVRDTVPDLAEEVVDNAEEAERIVAARAALTALGDTDRGRAGTLMSSSAVMSQTVTDQAG